VPKSRKRPAKRRRSPIPSTGHIRADQNRVAPEQDQAAASDLSKAIRQALVDAEAYGRLLLTQDLTLEALSHWRGAKRDVSKPAPSECWPVALIEPVNYRVLQLDDVYYSLTTAIASKLGLVQAQLGSTPPIAVNWTFRDKPCCELSDPTGTVLAKFRHAPDPQWRTAAHTQGHVLVLYGGELGVRKPDGLAAIEYDDRARDQELHAALAGATVLTALVPYVLT
jgi:hypothetical protein